MSVDDYKQVASGPVFRRYRVGDGVMMPDNEHGGWTLLSDALAAQEHARREERERIADWLETWADSYVDLPPVGGAIAGTLEAMAQDLRENWLALPGEARDE